MNKYFNQLLQEGKQILLNLDNCLCCLGHLARGKALSNYNNIHFSLTNPLLPEKKEYFPYKYIIGSREYYINYLKNNKIDLIIHDIKVNQQLYNAVLFLNKYKKIPQYFFYSNDWYINTINNFNIIEKILLPYPEYMKDEFIYINKISKIFIDNIYNFSSITEENIKFIKNKYNINDNKKTIVVSVSTGGWDFSEKVFQYAYDNYNNKEKYNLIMIYGIYYKGKIFKEIKSNIHENLILPLFSIADTVICQSSYNTLVEVINLNKNIISFPRHKYELIEVSRYAKYYNKLKVINLL